MKKVLILALAFLPAVSLAQYRCYVDGEVIYTATSCTKIKSRDTLAKEAKAADDAATSRKQAEAAVKEAGDRPNFSRRILLAQQATARHLRDPDSARFGSSRVSWFSGYPVVCGLVSGRNGFGGYANAVRFYAFDDFAVIDEGKGYSGFDEQWVKNCGP